MAVTFVADVKPLFRPMDIDAMKGFGFDLSKYQDVVAHADRILARVTAGTMPCDARWPPERVALFAQWISDGKLEKPPVAVVTFVADIKPLFRPRDVGAMKNFGGFDLSKYQDVVTHADGILARLKAGDMPCDAAWPPEKVALFAQWISDGKLENPPPPAPDVSATALELTAAPKKKPPTKKKATEKKVTTKKATKKKTATKKATKKKATKKKATKKKATKKKATKKKVTKKKVTKKKTRARRGSA
jgi:hypothetical protein